jgi:four helix bundle protein
MPGVRSHEELVCWQIAYELKLKVYELVETGTITRDFALRDQLREAAASAPRQMAEGFGRFYPKDFARLLRGAVGELKEVQDALRDGVDRGHFTPDQVVPLERLAKRSSKAAGRLIAYLRRATPPDDLPGKIS